MNAIAAVAWVLIGLLTVLQPDGVMAAGSAQNKAAVTATKSAPKDTASSKKSSIRKAELKKAELKKAPARKAPSKTAERTKKRPPVASKSKSAREIAKTPLPAAKLDLSLPEEMVENLQPPGTVPLPKREPLLPSLFGEKPGPFEINGRLLSNEMQLPLRNQERNEVEGAALEFQFKQ